MRKAARVDSTQAVIVGALRACGADVWVLGLPVDLLVGWRGRLMLMECKSLTGKKKPKPAKYTDLQIQFMDTWQGYPIKTVTSAEEAVEALRG